MPKWKELKRFCERDGWELYKDTDHYYYRKRDENGNIRLTKVSKGSGEIHQHMWKEILKKQLQVTQEYFNRKFQVPRLFRRRGTCSLSVGDAIPH